MQTSQPDPVKYFIGALLGGAFSVEFVVERVSRTFGTLDYISKPFPFEVTDYYESEMGRGLMRVFFSFEQLRDPGEIADFKLASNEIESEFLDAEGRRQVNLDPGYMDSHKLVLASAKYGAPKIYVGKGIYADPTLHYSKGRFHPYDWGFPDFRSGMYNDVLMEIRARFKNQRRRIRNGPQV